LNGPPGVSIVVERIGLEIQLKESWEVLLANFYRSTNISFEFTPFQPICDFEVIPLLVIFSARERSCDKRTVVDDEESAFFTAAKSGLPEPFDSTSDILKI
jgi:hypothetical protein